MLGEHVRYPSKTCFKKSTGISLSSPIMPGLNVVASQLSPTYKTLLLSPPLHERTSVLLQMALRKNLTQAPLIYITADKRAVGLSK